MLAFLFPGQGSQKVGMAAALRDTHPEVVDRWLTAADAAAGGPVARLSDEGPIEELTATNVAQPALFAVSMALVEVAADLGLRPDLVAGHSLGEYTAAAAAGSVDPEAGLRLVAERGRLMAAVQDETPGTMAAVMGLDIDQVERICKEASSAGVVAPANLNSPKQIVVSGEVDAVERLMTLATEAGADRAVRLQVGAAFHSELMRGVQQSLAGAMSEIEWRDAAAPIASNARGSLVTAAGDVRAALVAQIASPVRWTDCVRALCEAGATTFVEVGPGRVLAGLMRQIAPDVKVAPGDSAAALEKLAASL